jgi:NAD(P)H dehydrogenase (quinone)
MYLVTGASGHLGQLVITNLLETHKIPANKIIATTRKPETLAALKAKGVDVRAADFDDTATLVKAFKGATRLLLISTDALDRPGHRLEQHKNAIAAAEKAGVDHILYTSLPKPDTSAILFAPDHVGTEKTLAASSLTAAAEGKIAYIAREDLARAAAAALASDNGGKNTYTLTGAQEYTTGEIAKLVSDAVGKPIAVVQVPLEGLIQGLVGAGFPAPVARVFASFDTNIAQGGLSGVTGDYKKLTSNDNTPFASWLAKNKQAFLG